jgi:hypothetical protein
MTRLRLTPASDDVIERLLSGVDAVQFEMMFGIDHARLRKGGQEILDGSIMSVEEVVATIDAITATDIAQLAGELFRSDHLRLSVVGPVKEDGKLLALLKV